MAQETDPYWIGQTKINGMLCKVDWRLVEAFREVSRLLKEKSVDSSQLDQMINDVDEMSATVALENPPGCNPNDRTGGLGGSGGGT